MSRYQRWPDPQVGAHLSDQVECVGPLTARSYFVGSPLGGLGRVLVRAWGCPIVWKQLYGGLLKNETSWKSHSWDFQVGLKGETLLQSFLIGRDRTVFGTIFSCCISVQDLFIFAHCFLLAFQICAFLNTALKLLQNNDLYKVSIMSTLPVKGITNEMQFRLFP